MDKTKKTKPRNTLSLMTKKDKERFRKLCLTNNIKIGKDE